MVIGDGQLVIGNWSTVTSYQLPITSFHHTDDGLFHSLNTFGQAARSLACGVKCKHVVVHDARSALANDDADIALAHGTARSTL